MRRIIALLAVLTMVAGCASTDYGAGQIQSTPRIGGCAQANSPCAMGGDGL